MTTEFHWQVKSFEQLSPVELFDYLKLRQAVFIVEQTCAYPDIDDTDKLAHHLLGYKGGLLVACARLIPANVTYEHPSIGRIATHAQARGSGLGRQLMTHCVSTMHDLYPGQTIKIGAQQYLENFYQSFGFETTSDVYLEDGIPHIDMVLESPDQQS